MRMGRLAVGGLAGLLALSSGAALAEGDPDKGEKVFNRCRICHVADEETNRIGPHLVGIFGRRAGSVAGFNYSAAMNGSGITWDEETMAAFLADPDGYIPGNTMAFPGIRDEQDSVDLNAYLRIATVGGESLTLDAAKDAFIRRGGPSNLNEGGHPRLGVALSGRQRSLIGFDQAQVEAFVERHGLSAATLVLTIAEKGTGWQAESALVDARPLLESFAEGNAARWKLGREDRIAGKGRGVTWRCAKDKDIANTAADCDDRWNGGTYDARSAPAVLHSDDLEGEVTWDVTADVLAGHAAWLIRKADEKEKGAITYYSRRVLPPRATTTSGRG